MEVEDCPMSSCPRLSAVGRPGQLRVACIAGQKIEDAIDHKNATGLFAGTSFAFLFDGNRVDIDAGEIGRSSADSRQTQTQLVRQVRFETMPIAIGGVQLIVVCPGERPIVASFGLANNGFLRRPDDLPNDRAGRIRSFRTPS
jgi:hypothetical protein